MGYIAAFVAGIGLASFLGWVYYMWWCYQAWRDS